MATQSRAVVDKRIAKGLRRRSLIHPQPVAIPTAIVMVSLFQAADLRAVVDEVGNTLHEVRP